MKRLGSLALVCLCVSSVSAQEGAKTAAKPGAAFELKTTRDQASYAIGLNIGRNLKRDGLVLNQAAIVQGLIDALSGGAARLTDEQAQAALQALDRELQQEMITKSKVEGDKNKREGDAFLAANKDKPNVVTLPSGLQYSVIKSGTGKSPTANDVVTTHYHGTFVDGQVFDSSVERGEPVQFQVGGVIKGWTEALQKMKVGDKWRLFIPSNLAYGPENYPPVIGPNRVLIFDVELLGVNSGGQQESVSPKK